VDESSPVVLFNGFTLVGGLIIAIGAQNAYVLRQGLKRQHRFATASVCFLCDATLITIGTIGFGTLSSEIPEITNIFVWAGAVFLLFYGLQSFKSAFAPAALDMDKQDIEPTSLWSNVLMTLALWHWLEVWQINTRRVNAFCSYLAEALPPLSGFSHLHMALLG
jgi:L-lysine exporter family protein LysE/ArgO